MSYELKEVFYLSKKTYFIATLAMSAVAVSAIAPTAHAEKLTFKDLKGIDPGQEKAIYSLVDKGIIKGYEDQTFKPYNHVTRSNVTKFLAKWLVYNDYKIPADYKAKQRFNDVSLQAKDQELLQYAALVHDANVFKGIKQDKGLPSLAPEQTMTRGAMAVVLVRAIKELYDVDLIDLYKKDNFKTSIKDLTLLKDDFEKQEAIIALEFAKITTPEKGMFKPKDPVRRSHFAKFLDSTITNIDAFIEPEVPALTVKEATATSTTTLAVTLSDDSTHTVTLEKPLEENMTTPVSFVIDGVTYKADVRFDVKELKLLTTSHANSTTLQLHFNQAIDPIKLLNADHTLKNGVILFNSIGQAKNPIIASASLSNNQRTITLQLDTALAGKYNIELRNLAAASGETLTHDFNLTLEADTIAPTIVKVEQKNASLANVIFSEPMQAINAKDVTFTLANGTALENVKGTLQENSTEMLIDLSEATANGKFLAPNTKVQARFASVRDMAGNFIAPNPTIVELMKGPSDGIPPAYREIKQTGPTSFDIYFSEAVLPLKREELSVVKGDQRIEVKHITMAKDTPHIMSVTMTGANLDGSHTISLAKDAVIQDLSGETATFATTYTFNNDTQPPTVIDQRIITQNDEQIIALIFNKTMTLSDAVASATGTYTKDGVEYPVETDFIKNMTLLDDRRTLHIKLRDVLQAKNPEVPLDVVGANYQLSLKLEKLKSEYGVDYIGYTTLNFVRTQDSLKNQDIIIVKGIQQDPTDNNIVTVTFDKEVDAASATDISNYSIDGVTVEKATVEYNKLNTVKLTLKQNSITDTVDHYITIKNVHAKHSTVPMKENRQTIRLQENVSPTVQNIVVKDGTTLEVTFSENVIVENLPFEIAINNAKVDYTIATKATDAKTQVISLAQGKIFKAGDLLSIQPNIDKSNTIKDQANNPLSFSGYSAPISFN